jgi:transposase
MKTYSLDFREKIVAIYDQGGISQQALADRFCVSVFFVKKLFRQRRAVGTIAPLPKSGWQKGLLTDEMNEFLIALYRENKKIKIREIADGLEEKFRVRLSNATICRSLKKLKTKRDKK